MNQNMLPTGSSQRAQSRGSKSTEQDGQYAQSPRTAKRRGHQGKSRYQIKRVSAVNVDKLRNWRDGSAAEPVNWNQENPTTYETGMSGEAPSGKAVELEGNSNTLRMTISIDKGSEKGSTSSKATADEDPVNGNSLAVTSSKPTIIMLSPRDYNASVKSDEEDLDITAGAFYSRLSAKLEKQADLVHVSMASSEHQLEEKFERFLAQPPTGVVLMNSEFYNPSYAQSHEHLRRYIEGGGIVVVICECISAIDIAYCTTFMHFMSVYWNIRDCAKERIRAHVRMGGGLKQKLPLVLDCQSFYIRHVEDKDALYYRQVLHRDKIESWRAEHDYRPLTPFAYTQVGEGKFGFAGGFRQWQILGSVRDDTVDDIIHMMLCLRVEPWETATVPDLLIV